MGVFNTVRSGLNVLFTPVLYGVVASLAIQLATWEKGDRTQDKMQDQAEGQLPFRDKFDFIVVGGGTAGCVVANRLSEYYSVLLLEAGGEPNPLVNVPSLASQLVNRPEVDWMHKTVAQRRGGKMGQFKRASWAQGRGLGGSGNLDWMIGLRGHPKDFDNWGKLVGDEGWGYKEFLKYFQRHENFVGNTTDPAAHATGGELTIQLPDFRPLAAEFVWAAKELGYPNLDLNGRFTEGFDEIFYPTKRGEKMSTYRAFLEPIKRREKLTIRKYAVVTKILLNKNDNSAYGLEYERHGQKYTVYSTREIVLSAGTVQTPKLLMLSGIGPKKHLEDVGIKPRINLPVGRNLQDHLAVFLGPFFIKDPLSFNFDRDVTAKTFFEYGTFGQGPVTTTGFSATGLFASSFAKLRGENEWPDVQLLMHGVSVHSNYGGDMAHSFGLQEEPMKKYYKHAVGRHSFHIVVSLARPYARGEVRLASRNPTAPLIIDPKYLEDPWEFDVKTMVEGVKKAVELVESTKKFQGLEGQFTSEVLPGCESVSKFKSDQYWECYVRQYTVSLHNPVGTCSMGPKGSPHAVVDAQLKLIGAKKLRVVDASVMPSIVVGGTSQATIAIAEKGAESILREWKGGHQAQTQDQIPGQAETKVEPIVATTKGPVPTAFRLPVTAPTTTATTARPLFNFNFLQQPQSPLPQLLPQQTSQEKQTVHNPWQEAMDSIASFSRTIQQTFKLPPTSNSNSHPNAVSSPIVVSTPVTTPVIPTSLNPVRVTVTTTTTSRRPKVQVQNSMFNNQNNDYVQYFTTAPQKYSTNAPHKYSTSPSPSPTPKIIPLPTQTFHRKKPIRITSNSPYPTPTTFRPPHRPHEYDNKNKNNTRAGFSLNIPIVKGTTFKPSQHQSQGSAPLKVYHSPKPVNANRFIQNIILKEQQSQFEIQKPVFPPTTTTTTRSTSIWTTPSTTTTPRPPRTRAPTLQVTTRRPSFETIQREQYHPHLRNYYNNNNHHNSNHNNNNHKNTNNMVDYPLTSVSYFLADSTPANTITAPGPTTSSTTTATSTVATPSKTLIIPAISLPNPLLETTTARITAPSFQRLVQTQIQTIPQDVYLTGLEPIKLLDVSTATEVPQDFLRTSSLTSSSSSTSTSAGGTSEEPPLFYVVRKKYHHKHNPNSHSDENSSMMPPPPPKSHHHQHNHHNHHHHNNRPRSRRPQLRPQKSFMRNLLRPHHHHSGGGRKPPTMTISQSQRNYPQLSLPPGGHNQIRSLHSHRQNILHFLEHERDHQAMESAPLIQSVIQRPESPHEELDGIITPAISSPLYQQNVLNQLIPIQRK